MPSVVARALGPTVAILTMLVLLAGAGEARAAPARCQVGTYITSLSQVDTAAGTFRADFWMWSICPTLDLEPLKTLEFVNAVSVEARLASTLKRDGGWWATRKFTGVFRQDFSLRNYPFDEQPLVIEIEEGVLDTRDFVYVADNANSGMNPKIDLAGWRLKDFRLNAGVTAHPTTFGVVLSFVSVEKLVGPHDGVYLLDKLHFATLALIMAATCQGVISLRAVNHGGDAALQRRQDLRRAIGLLAAYLVLNLVLIGLAIVDAKA